MKLVSKSDIKEKPISMSETKSYNNTEEIIKIAGDGHVLKLIRKSNIYSRQVNQVKYLLIITS